jgi:hypothetical protein
MPSSGRAIVRSMEPKIARAWDQYESGFRRLREHHKGLIYEAVDRVEPRISPPVHREILIIWAHLMLDEAIDLWMHTATELGGRKTVRTETFEEHALWRIERRLMNFNNPAALGFDVEETAPDDTSLPYRLTWDVMRTRRFASEDEAKEASRALSGVVVLSRPDGTYQSLNMGEVVPE